MCIRDSLFVDSHVEQSAAGSSAAGAAVPPLQPNHTYHWQHVIDTCARYTQANIVTSRSTQSLLRGLQELWIRPQGPPH
eukprot:5947780-Prorocentrum_lima.AAC.1